MPRSQVRILPGPFLALTGSDPLRWARVENTMNTDNHSGDDGTTGLIGGHRVDKDSIRVETLGDLDELNCLLGLAAAVCGDEQLAGALGTLQHHLFDLGADLATPHAGDASQDRVGQPQIDEVERIATAVTASLPEIQSLIIPGGSEAAARLHLARAVCRRAERLCVALHHAEPVKAEALVYLNRLGDLLFLLARRANQLAGITDTQWPPGSPTTDG